MKTIALIVLCSFVSINTIRSAEVNYKLGKVSQNEMKSSVCPIDSNAHSYFIFDQGKTYFSYYEGFVIHFSRHFRIKILDNNGVDNATIEIPYYNYGSQKEKITSIKGYTFNLNDNKIEKQKLDKDAIFDEPTSKYISTIKFAMPNVKPGSVIDVTYSVSSERLFKLPDWKLMNLPLNTWTIFRKI